MRRALALAGLPVVLAWLGCGGSPAQRAAEAGDYARLRAALTQGGGRLSNGQAAEVARAVIAREIEAGEDPLARVREVRACAPEVDDALARRMKTHDTAGGEAALARVEAGGLDPDDLREHVADPEAAWRAAAVRGLTREKDRAARQRAMLDLSPLVRRQALEAARAAADPLDFEAVAEAARLDPVPLVRAEAVRALAVQSNPRAANVLRDLWVGADESLREDIALAWGAPAVFGRGGRDALRVVLAAEHGSGALQGASAVLRLGDRADRELVAAAHALILRTIDMGTRAQRLQAIAMAHLEGDPTIQAAILRASKGDDPEIRLGALSRLIEVKEHRADAVRALEAMANGPDVALASRARFLLAMAGDPRWLPQLEATLSSPDPKAKLGAAVALAALGRSAKVAPLLADADPSVRTRAACTLLLAGRPKGD